MTIRIIKQDGKFRIEERGAFGWTAKYITADEKLARAEYERLGGR